MKLVFQIAGGIVLALFILFCLNIALTVAPAAGGFFGALFSDPGFLGFLGFVAVIGISALVFLKRR
ncbi:MAG: hypothetical protein PS018_14745 [bacterium]|nr:hypothetical protein [bacterium]